MTKDNKIELMAPAGDFDSMQAALDNGADSIYFGVEQLNMRARATVNFTMDDLEEIVDRCEAKGVRTYLTLNTIIFDHDLRVIKSLLDRAKEANITAVIAMDQAVISYAKSIGVEIHISTQLNITNLETVKFYSHFADTMVMARELSLRQVKFIVDGIKRDDVRGPSGNLIEVEIFGHGALCMATSGKCYLSLHAQNSSANRGACKQECRRAYEVKDLETGNILKIENEYIMSPKDLAVINFLDELIETGAKVLKIEGRGRAPEYVATVIKNYREAIDAYYDGTFSDEKVADWMESLRTVYNRDFWGGYLYGKELGEWSSTSGSQATQKKTYIGKGRHYYPKPQIGEFLIEAHGMKVGDHLLITGPTTGAQEFVLESMMANDVKSDECKRTDIITIPLPFRIRPSDRLYKIEKTEFAQKKLIEK
ncbi:MAG: U32 family peptidase [Flavobacteriales bacterium]|nr:U32 family peptidase [Flavobacteriales bacterium]